MARRGSGGCSAISATSRLRVLDGGLGDPGSARWREGEETIEPAVFEAARAERRRRHDGRDPRAARRPAARACRRAAGRSLPRRGAGPRSRRGPHPRRGQRARSASAPAYRRSCSRRTRSPGTAARASPPACRCSRCIEPAALTRASTPARGASGRARACLLRLDAGADRPLPSTMTLPDLDVGVGVALRARRERRLRPTPQPLRSPRPSSREVFFVLGSR